MDGVRGVVFSAAAAVPSVDVPLESDTESFSEFTVSFSATMDTVASHIGVVVPIM